MPYTFLPHERPLMPGSAATPAHPPARRLAYGVIGVLLGLTGGFANGLLVASVSVLQGALGLTQVEAGWLTAAYSMSNVCMSMLMIKFRQQFGLNWFARLFLPAFVAVQVLQFFAHGYAAELAVRAASGVVASAMSSLTLLYMIQAMPAQRRLGGMVLGVGITQIGLPLGRVITPALLSGGEVQNLYTLELGLSLLCLGCATLLPLPPSERVRAFEPLDFLTFALLAPGVALLCAVLALGRIVWWPTPWIGWSLAGAVVLIGAALLVEHARANPLLNTRWLASGQIVQFALLAATMRVLLSEQSYGATGLLTLLGMGAQQLVGLYAVVTLATLAGLAYSVLRLDPTDLLRPVVLSLVLITLAAWLDSRATNLTRPASLYFSQAAMGFAAISFVGPLMMTGLLRAIAKGPNHLVSFSAAFGISQTVGGLGGTALLGTLQIVRTRVHATELMQQLGSAQPLVSGRVEQLGQAYARVLGDAALRQAEGAVLLAQQVTREANVLAYNDVFRLIAVLAALAALGLGARWAWWRAHGFNPLAEELAALQRLRAQPPAS